MENQNQLIAGSSKVPQTLSSNLVRRGLDGYSLIPAQYPIRVMIVDDIIETRENIKKIFRTDEKIEIIASTGSSYEAIDLYQKLKPDIVLQDIHRPEMDGITMTRKLKSLDHEVKVLILSVVGLDYFNSSRDAGAMGVMSKPPSGDELIDIIHLIHQSKPGAMFSIPSSFSEFTYYLDGKEFLPSAEVRWDSSSRFFRNQPMLWGARCYNQGRDILRNIPIDRIASLNLNFPYLEIIDFQLLYSMNDLQSLLLPEHLIHSLGNNTWQEIKTEIIKRLYSLRCIYVGSDKTYTRK